jgi:hypothetical protein
MRLDPMDSRVAVTEEAAAGNELLPALLNIVAVELDPPAAH